MKFCDEIQRQIESLLNQTIRKMAFDAQLFACHCF